MTKALSAGSSKALAAGISSLGNIAGGMLSNATQYASNKKLAVLQAALNYHYAQKSAENSPSWNRKGLETAGYNPMLAVQNATSGVNSSWTSAQGTNAPDLGLIGSDMVSNAQSVQRLKNETDTAESTIDLNYANADKAKAEKSALMEKMPFISQREKAEIGNIDKDSMLKESQIHNIDETTKFIEKRYELDKMLGIMGINAQYYSADKGYQGTVYNADKLQEIADDHSPSGRSSSFRNYTEGVSDILRSVGGYFPWYNSENTYHVGADGQVKSSHHKTTKKGRRK